MRENCFNIKSLRPAVYFLERGSDLATPQPCTLENIKEQRRSNSAGCTYLRQALFVKLVQSFDFFIALLYQSIEFLDLAKVQYVSSISSSAVQRISEQKILEFGKDTGVWKRSLRNCQMG